jgi:hypothetical protein
VLPGSLQVARYFGPEFFNRAAKDLKNSLDLRNGDPHNFYLKVRTNDISLSR